MAKINITYRAEPTGTLFHYDDSFVRGVMGPVRSGKSTMMSVELMRRAHEQQPGPDGVRRSRWAIIRNTYRELEDTTLKTWLDWHPEDRFGSFNKNSMSHRIRTKDLDAEFLFRALDKPKDIAKMLSLELTGGWINEAREIPKAILDTLTDRVGQYPAKKDGGCTWRGVVMDTNPPDEDHWWYKLAEEEAPLNWRFFRQPGGILEVKGAFLPNPDAENIGNLTEGHDYYLTRLAGKAKDYIRVYYCGQYGFVVEGKPVHPDYVDATHCPGEYFRPSPRLPIIVGLDFGLTPAAVFLQKLALGRWIAFDELCGNDIGAKRFGRSLKRHINAHYPNFKFEFWGDPAGDDRAQTDEETVYQVLATVGIDAVPVFTNDVTVRREALAEPLRRLVDGKPAFMISPQCKTLRKGLAGGFAYRRIQISGEERYHDKPDKNIYSHPVEACEYGMIGGGEGARVIQTDFDPQTLPERYNLDYDDLGI